VSSQYGGEGWGGGDHHLALATRAGARLQRRLERELQSPRAHRGNGNECVAAAATVRVVLRTRRTTVRVVLVFGARGLQGHAQRCLRAGGATQAVTAQV